MEEILEKISSYNLFNYLLPGILFAVISKEITTYSFLHENIIIGLFLYYFIEKMSNPKCFDLKFLGW